MNKIWNTSFSFYYFLLGKFIQVVLKYVLLIKLYLEFIYLDVTYFITQVKSHLLSPCFIIFSSITPSRDHDVIILFLSIWFMVFILGCQCTCRKVGLVACDSCFFGRTLRKFLPTLLKGFLAEIKVNRTCGLCVGSKLSSFLRYSPTAARPTVGYNMNLLCGLVTNIILLYTQMTGHSSGVRKLKS